MGKKINVFISYSSVHDLDKMEQLYKKINNSRYFQPLVVDKNTQADTEFGDKVINELEKCSFFIPILTTKSYTSQWVNQEIGFAKSLCRIEKIQKIIPIVEDELLNNPKYKFKGFIHPHRDVVTFTNENCDVFYKKTSVKVLNLLNNELKSKPSLKDIRNNDKVNIRLSIDKFNIKSISGNILIEGEDGKIRIVEFQMKLVLENLSIQNLIISGIAGYITYEVNPFTERFLENKIGICLDNYQNNDNTVYKITDDYIDLKSSSHLQLLTCWKAFIITDTEADLASQIFSGASGYIQDITVKVYCTNGEEEIKFNLL